MLCSYSTLKFVHDIGSWYVGVDGMQAVIKSNTKVAALILAFYSKQPSPAGLHGCPGLGPPLFWGRVHELGRIPSNRFWM